LTAFDDLTRLVPPPRRSRNPATEWPAVEAALGVALPPDYKALVEVYGLGQFDDFLSVFHPETANPHLNLQRAVTGPYGALWALRTLREGGEAIPYPIFPESGGLLPWGITDNGNVCYWRTASSNPSRWTVAVNESRGPTWDDFAGTMVDFLLAVLSRRRRCVVFPDDFPSDHPTFTPHDG